MWRAKKTRKDATAGHHVMKQPLIFLQGQLENIVVKSPSQINLLKPIYAAAAEGIPALC